MCPYSIDTDERKKILFALAIISIGFSWWFFKLFGACEISLPWWIQNPSVLFFYWLFFLIFDKWLWRCLKNIHFIKTPNLNGDWKGKIKSSFDSHSSEGEAILKIFQTWTRIKILLETDKSLSHSESASIVIDAPEGKYLSYQYINEPRSNVIETMSMHRGTAMLIFDEKKNTLEGQYYSGKGRQKFGSLHFVRDNVK